MMKEFNWKESLYLLNNNFLKNEALNNKAEVRKHIDGLIDCINELFFERKMVKYEYEKVAITLCSVEYQYKVMKKKEGRDTQEAITSTRIGNKLIKRKLKHEYDIRESEANAVKLKTALLVKENETLKDPASKSRKISRRLTKKMGSVISNTSVAKISIADKRTTTVGVYENILYLVEEIESKGTDDQNYWQQTQKDLESLTQEAEKWKLKIQQADVEAKKQKIISEELKKKSKSMQARNNEAVMKLEIEVKDLEELSVTRKKLSKNLKNLNQELEEEKALIPHHTTEIETTRHQFQEKIDDLIENSRNVKEEFVDEIRIHEEILLESDWLASAKTNLKNHLYEIQSGNKDQKSFVKTATSVLLEIMGDIARNKEENFMLKENLFIVVDGRDTMEKIYSKKLRHLRTDLLSEMHLRQKAASDLHALDDFLRKFIETESPFPYDENLIDRLSAEEEKLLTSLVAMGQTEVRCRKAIQETQEKIEQRKKLWEEEITKIQQRIKNHEKVVKELKIIKDDHQEVEGKLRCHNRKLEKECGEMITEYRAFNENVGKNKKQLSIFSKKSREVKMERKKYIKETKDWNLRLKEQMIRYNIKQNLVNIEIYCLMNRIRILSRVNKITSFGLKREDNLAKYNLSRTQKLQEMILHIIANLHSYQAQFQQLASEETQLHTEANFDFNSTMHGIADIKSCSKDRLMKVAETAQELGELIESCIDISQPRLRKVGSHSALKCVERLKKKRLSK